MVELSVKVEGGGVLVAGETIQCLLFFTNTSKETQTIAWVGAQLHCQCLVRPEVVKLKELTQISSPVNDTAFFPNRGERGVSILSTRSNVLACNFTLKPEETRKVTYREEVPTGGPPSFHGRLVRYTYKLTVGAQKPNCPAQIVRIPIRIITIPVRLQRPLLTSPQSSNPFLVNEERHSASEIGLEAIAAEAGRRTSSSYTLTASGDTLGRILTPRSSYRVGDEVTIVLDCSHSVHQVLQVTVTLVCVEIIKESCRQHPAGSKPFNTVVARETQCCTNSLITSFSLPVPPGFTQSFSNETLTVQWELQFQLLISKGSWTDTHTTQQSIGPGGGVAEVWVGPLPQQVETVNWSLPITVLPSINNDLVTTSKQTVTL